MRKELEKQLDQLTVLKGGKLLTKNNGGKPLPGISVHKDAISHPIKKRTIAYFEKKGKIQNGINIVKENGNYVAKWRLVLANGEIDDQVFSQVLCPIN